MTPKIPTLTPRKTLSKLERAGFAIHRTCGGHVILKSMDGARRVTLPMHNKDLKLKTLRSIIAQAGLSRADFFDL